MGKSAKPAGTKEGGARGRIGPGHRAVCLRKTHTVQSIGGKFKGSLSHTDPVGSNVTFLRVLQQGFGGTACETCANDNLYGLNCSQGRCDFHVINTFLRGWENFLAGGEGKSH